MARPTKQGLDYFPMDCSLDDDTQLFIAEHGPESLGILISLWSIIYKNEGYFVIYDKKLPLKIKRRIMADVDQIDHVIHQAIEWDLFDQGLFEDLGILTSSGIQKRFLLGTKQRKEVQMWSDLVLIDVSISNNLVNVNGNPVNIDRNTTKKSKVKEIKEKESKEEESNNSIVELKPDVVMDIFNHWRQKLNHPRSALDSKRKKIIKAALKTHEPETLKLAIDGMSVTPHNIGQNKERQRYDGLHIVFKDADQIDRFVSNAENPPVHGDKHSGFSNRDYSKDETKTEELSWLNQ